MGYDDYDSKRTIGIRDKQILYRNAKGRCQNPACGKKIEFDEMQVGHKTAWSRGGRTTLANSVCLCYRCNKLQGTDSWATFLKKQGVVDQKTQLKKSLQALTLSQLKDLASKHKLKVRGKIVEGFFDSHRKAPTKTQYINKLVGIVTEKEINKVLAKDTIFH
jgi:hypothetical protein